MNPRLKAVGQAVGIEFTGKCDRYPNTLRAHALLEYASEVDGGRKQNDLMEVMFKVGKIRMTLQRSCSRWKKYTKVPLLLTWSNFNSIVDW